MISDVLKVDEWKVMHIMAVDKENEHLFTQPVNIVKGNSDMVNRVI